MTIFNHLTTSYRDQNGITCISTFLSVEHFLHYELRALCACQCFIEQSHGSKIELYRGFSCSNWACLGSHPQFLGRLDEWDRSTESGDAGSSGTMKQEAESCEVVGLQHTHGQSVSVGRFLVEVGAGSWRVLLFHSHPQHHSAD